MQIADYAYRLDILLAQLFKLKLNIDITFMTPIIIIKYHAPNLKKNHGDLIWKTIWSVHQGRSGMALEA